MKLTAAQLQNMGYTEVAPGDWRRSISGTMLDPILDPRIISKPPKRIRQSSKPPMNKLEQEWFEELKRKQPSDYLCQSIRFMLANGLWYKPDVVCFHMQTCWEVKGPFAHRGGFENLKMAAHKYPWFRWKLIWKENGKWQEQEVLP